MTTRDPGAATPASLLDDVRIASPCKASWDDMVGDDRVRFCGQCAKNVYNLSALSRDAAEALLRAADARQADSGEGVCVRLYRRADGTVLTADCPDGVRRKKRRLALFGAVGAGLMAAGAAATASTVRRPMPVDVAVASPTVAGPAETSIPVTPVPFPIMGDVAMPPPTTSPVVTPPRTPSTVTPPRGTGKRTKEPLAPRPFMGAPARPIMMMGGRA
jgi:hypothetical protein